MKDFFISHAQKDRNWAEWIAWTLEGAGYSDKLPSRDFKPGSNFVLEMHRAVAECRKTVLVLSPASLESSWVRSEWEAALYRDPTGKDRTLVPVRVEPVDLPPVLRPIVPIHLVGKDEEKAKDVLLAAISEKRAKPERTTIPAATHVAVPHRPLSPTLGNRLLPIQPNCCPILVSSERTTQTLGKAHSL